MSDSIKSQDNISVIHEREAELARGLLGLLSVSPCFIFLYINGVMLFTLRSKPMFQETSRYILLYNLLFADTFQLALGQVMYILVIAGVYMTRYVCVILTMFAILTTDISPFNLAVMSLERYIAVCFPLTYPNIVTARSTGAAIAVVWAICSANTFVRFLILFILETTPFHRFMDNICSKESIFYLKIFFDFDKGFMCVVFVSVGLIIICSYVGVIFAARSASSDKASVIKASKTVLLHLLQLCLSLSTTLVSTILSALHGKVDRLTLLRIYYVLFLCLINLPRCLSCLIYGLRDQTIRPVLMYHLSLGLRQPRMSVVPLHKR